MQRSESIKELAGALAKAQGAMKPAGKDAVNPQFKSKYATLASIQEACREALSANGLSYAQIPHRDDAGKMVLETILMHVSGEWLSGKYPVEPAVHTPQGVGSALTYAKKYSLAAMVGIASDDDDDGNAAEGERKPAKSVGKPPVAEAAPKAEVARAASPFYLRIIAAIEAAPTVEKLLEIAKHTKAWTTKNPTAMTELEKKDALQAWDNRQKYLNYNEKPAAEG